MPIITVSQVLTDKNLESILRQYEEDGGIQVMVTDRSGAGKKLGNISHMPTASEVYRPHRGKNSISFAVTVSLINENIPKAVTEALKQTGSVKFAFINFFGKWYLSKPGV